MPSKEQVAGQRKHAYVVGYSHDRNVVYGADDHEGKVQYLRPYTLHTGKQALRRFPSVGKTVVLYRLVPVETRVVTEEDRRRGWRRLRLDKLAKG